MKKADWLSRLQRVGERAQSFQQAPLTSRYRPRLSRPAQPASVWRLFPRQSLAISFSHSCREDVHVFALEKEESGQRIYLVTSYSELWHYYSTYRQSLMHCYEVIPEGAVCKLYLDLEFHKPTNHGRDGQGMVASLIQVVCEQLEEVFGVVCSSREVVNLDSSTEDKFSRHLIFLLPDAAFKDNTHVGSFLRAVLQPVLTTLERRGEREGNSLLEEEPQEKKKKRQEERDLSFLLVKNKEGENCLFVDLSVYTKNRNFRLYRSSKAGRNAAFTIAPDNLFTTTPKRNAEQDLFLCSLISNVSFVGQRILTWDEPESDRRNTRTCTTTGSLEGYQSSPHSEVDDFVVTLLRRDGVQGHIRRWSYFVSQQLLVYDIMGFRWCHNIGRAHKSNNIMIVVDLREEVWYQKCHDPACKTFRSSSLPLPQDLCVSYIITMDEEDQAYLMDESGNLELIHTPPAGQPRDTASSWGKDEDAAGLGPPGGQGGSDTGRTQGGEEAGWGEDGPDDLLYLEALEDVESNTHTTHSNTHTTHSNTHPTDSDTHPSDSNTHPTDSDTHPTDSDTHPTDRNTHPTDSDTHPTDSNTHTPEDVSDQLLLQIMDEFEGRTSPNP